MASLESWKSAREWKPSETVGLQKKVAQGQGKAVAQALGQILSGIAPVVLTGQQPGLAGGPLFVWLKAHSAIVHAERISAQTGLPVRALFWVAGDDSDLDEVRHLSDPVNGAMVDSHPGISTGLRSVGDRPFPKPKAVIDWAQANWPAGALASILRESRPDLSSVMIACLRHWFGDRLVVVDARWPEVRALAPRTYRTFAKSFGEIHQALVHGMDSARAAGLKVAIRSWPDKLRLFRLGEDGARRRISSDASTFSDGAGWSIPMESLPAVLEREQERFSHDVVSRPFAAEEIFPVAAHVLGPGEFAYFACLGEVSRVVGAPLAPALARASCTVLPAGPWTEAIAAGWDPSERSSGPWDTLKTSFLRANHPEASLWTKTWADARSDYLEQLSAGKVDPAIEAMRQKLSNFEAKLHASRLGATAASHVAELANLKRLWNLAGAGGLQERLLSPWALEHHLQQPELMRRLAEAVDPDNSSHVVWEAK